MWQARHQRHTSISLFMKSSRQLMGKRSWKWVQVTLFHIPFFLPSSARHTHIHTYIQSTSGLLAYSSLNSFDRFASINHMNSLRVIGDQESIQSYRKAVKGPLIPVSLLLIAFSSFLGSQIGISFWRHNTHNYRSPVESCHIHDCR